MNVSDHADVVLKKSDEKILSGDKVMPLCKSAFFSNINLDEARNPLLSHSIAELLYFRDVVLVRDRQFMVIPLLSCRRGDRTPPHLLPLL